MCWPRPLNEPLPAEERLSLALKTGYDMGLENGYEWMAAMGDVARTFGDCTGGRRAVDCALAADVDESYFAEKLYPVLHAAQCVRCHSDNGVASETQLEFPRAGAERGADHGVRPQADRFGRSEEPGAIAAAC